MRNPATTRRSPDDPCAIMCDILERWSATDREAALVMFRELDATAERSKLIKTVTACAHAVNGTA